MKKPTPFGKYFLLERINVGGMAEVFRAKAFGVEGFERLVAVKRILPNIAEDKDFIRMFIEEAKLSVQLNHANIAQIFDLGVVESSYYIALEHVHGRDLRGIFDRCRTVGEAMPVAQACFIAMKACEGLDYAHNKRDQSGRELALVHRDVSPQNVLVSFEGEVKIIDFGIAKAAGKGSKTQAGILKGKFGYMSPEQVRGLPVDRRSDVFSCGIVLYELLTGEWLFVGESDFSTLEKVRNVEILPPSTYNRRIPDELERIVLKALAKDTEDRYQNAIDLHDELQAFVYTAGEFYSRKDLAGWMKKTFGKEIEEETAKLESYRQLKPPPAEPVTLQPRTVTGRQTPPPRGPTTGGVPELSRKSTQAMNAVGTKPPPPPPRVSSSQLPVQVAAVPSLASKPPRERGEDSSDQLNWDDDELETQIYDNPEDDPRNKTPQPIAAKSTSKQLPLSAPTSSQPGIPGVPRAPAGAPTQVAAAQADPFSQGPDLSGLVGQTARGWEGGAHPSGSMPTNGHTNGNGNGANGSHKMATGSHPQTAQAMNPTNGSGMYAENGHHHSGPFAVSSGMHSAPYMAPTQPFDPMATFGKSVSNRDSNKRNILLIAIGGAVVAAIAVILVVVLTGGDGPTKVADKGSNDVTNPVKTPAPADPNTGFDLYVTPPGLITWKLDGESRQDRLPSRIRSIPAGTHTIQIEPPAGFLSQSQQVTIELGKAPKVEIVLEPIKGITGLFDSTPPGAMVSLIVDGKREVLGPSPQKAPLDPRHSYQVLFEKQGYVSVNRPIVFTGIQEETVSVPLEKTGAVATTEPPKVPDKPDNKLPPVVSPPIKPPIEKPPVVTPPVKPPVEKPPVEKPPVVIEKPPVVVEKPKGTGTLTLGSKPPCEIYVDGAPTGLHTPQPKMSLPAGKHRITLINNEFGINERFVVDIKPDAVEKVIKDFSDRLPK